MLRAISLFEIRYYLRHPLFYGTTLFLGFVMFVVMASDAIELGGAVGNVYRNAPYVLIRLMAILTILGMFVVTAFVASSAYRDFDHNTHPLFFSKPIRKRDYLLGRFLGSLAIAVLVFVGPALGLLLGSFMPWLDPERLGPTQLAPYVYSFLVFVLPNLLFLGAVFFVLTTLSRSHPYNKLVDRNSDDNRKKVDTAPRLSRRRRLRRVRLPSSWNGSASSAARIRARLPPTPRRLPGWALCWPSAASPWCTGAAGWG